MSASGLSAIATAASPARAAGARAEVEGEAGAFPALLAGSEPPTPSAPPSPALAAAPEATPDNTDASEPQSPDASLLAALGLAPLPPEPAAAGGWSAASATGFGGLLGAQLPEAPSAALDGATTAPPLTAQATRAVPIASAAAPAVEASLPQGAGGVSTAALAAIALAQSTSAPTARAAATADAQAAPVAVQALTATAAATATATLAPTAPAAALGSSLTARTGAAPELPTANKRLDGAALDSAQLSALKVDTASIRLTALVQPASPRPAADFSLGSLPGQGLPGAPVPASSALEPIAARDAIALSLAGTDLESTASTRRPAGETGFLLPTTPFGLERADLTTSPRESLMSLPPLLVTARLDAASPQFSSALGQQMQWMATQQIGRAELRLDPEELGPLEIRLEMNGDEIRAEFSSRSAEVRNLLETQVPRLRELLAEQGFSLADAQVGQERAAYQDAPQQREQFASREDSAEPARPDSAESSSATAARQRQGLVDDFA
jgi:flagellar hook-length control protein FliK